MYMIEVARMSQHAGGRNTNGLNCGTCGSESEVMSAIAPNSPKLEEIMTLINIETEKTKKNKRQGSIESDKMTHLIYYFYSTDTSCTHKLRKMQQGIGILRRTCTWPTKAINKWVYKRRLILTLDHIKVE